MCDVLGIELRPFNESDWNGFARAVRFSNMSSPLIGELKIDNVPHLVVIDKNGISLIRCDEQESYEEVYINDDLSALDALFCLRPEMSMDFLLEFFVHL